MENTTMENAMDPMSRAIARVRSERPQLANTCLLADVLVTDQGTTVSAARPIAGAVGSAAGLVPSTGKSPIQGKGFGPFAGYAPIITNHKFMDVVHVRSGRPPI